LANNKNILYGLNDNPPIILTLFLALQHLLLYIPGTIVMPLIIANILGLPGETKELLVFTSILASGITSFIQIRRFGRVGSGYMLFMGPSGAFLSCSIAAGMVGGFGLIAAMTILSAPLEILASYFMRYVRKIITPVMGGIVIMLIVISVIPILMSMWTGQPDSDQYCSSGNLITGLVTIAIIILLSIFGNSFLRIWSPLFGIAGGILTAHLTGITEFASLSSRSLIGLPTGKWIFPDFRFNLSYIPVYLSFLFATLASTIETIGDGIMIQEASDRDLQKVNYETVQRTLLGDGVGNIISGLFGNLANTTYSGNIAVIKLTGVASRKVGLFASVMLVLLAFFPKLIAIISLVPDPVIGSSSLVLMGLLFAGGIKLIASSELDYTMGLIIGVSLTLGIISTFKLFFPPLLPDTIKPFLENGVATGGLCAILLNLLTKLRTGKHRSIKLKYQITQLKELQKFINSFTADQNISQEKSSLVQLASEEIFAYICTKNPQKTGDIHFKLSVSEDEVLTTVEDRSNIKDVDLVDDTGPMMVDPEELGLLILNKIVKEIEHVRINGYNTISFKI